jgi:hypothetical protein
MISVDLAKRLDEAGLEWVPSEGDKFAIPGRDLDSEVFTVSEMTIEVQPVVGGKRIAFNGAVEWALDSIMQSEVVWLPSESQLRDRLGSTFRELRHADQEFVCAVSFEGSDHEFRAASPDEAYGQALLELLRDPEMRLRSLLDGT